MGFTSGLVAMLSIDTGSAATASNSGETLRSKLDVTILRCDSRSTDMPSVTIINPSKRSSIVVNSRIIRVLQPGVCRLAEAVDSGELRLDVTMQRCERTDDVTVLPGRVRYKSIQLRPRLNPGKIIAIDYAYEPVSLAGTLPLSGVTGSLTTKDGKYKAVVVEGDAYYVDSVLPGSYFLEIIGDGFSTRIPINLNQKYTIRDISIDDILAYKKP